MHGIDLKDPATGGRRPRGLTMDPQALEAAGYDIKRTTHVLKLEAPSNG